MKPCSIIVVTAAAGAVFASAGAWAAAPDNEDPYREWSSPSGAAFPVQPGALAADEERSNAFDRDGAVTPKEYSAGTERRWRPFAKNRRAAEASAGSGTGTSRPFREPFTPTSSDNY